MTDEELPAWVLKLRRLEREYDELGPDHPTAEEIYQVCEDVLTLSRMRARGELPPHQTVFTRREGKIEFEQAAVRGTRQASPVATWKLRRRMMRCGKKGCTTCPHGPYLYVRITAPGGAVSDVSLGRAPGARHVFEKLGGKLEGGQISEIVAAIREEGR